MILNTNINDTQFCRKSVNNLVDACMALVRQSPAEIMSGYDGVNEGEERANYYRVVELSISSKLKIWKTLKMVL